MNDLSAFLFDRAEFGEVCALLNYKPGFLLYFPDGRREHVLTRFNFALGYGPMSVVFVGEKWPARMREKYFQLSVALSIQNQPRADA